jgi:hypothetical protein
MAVADSVAPAPAAIETQTSSQERDEDGLWSDILRFLKGDRPPAAEVSAL